VADGVRQRGRGRGGQVGRGTVGHVDGPEGGRAGGVREGGHRDRERLRVLHLVDRRQGTDGDQGVDVVLDRRAAVRGDAVGAGREIGRASCRAGEGNGGGGVAVEGTRLVAVDGHLVGGHVAEGDAK